MERRDHPFDNVWREMERMRQEVGGMIDQIHTGNYLPAMSGGMLPAIRGQCKVDVCEVGDEVIVVADLPGVDKSSIYCKLINPRLFCIRCDQNIEKESGDKGYYVRERMYGVMQRTVPLPCDVTDKDSTATFKNGVLEIHLKKVAQLPEEENRIQITEG